MRKLLPALCLLSLLAACGGGTTLVIIERLAPGGGERGDGGSGQYARPQLDILVKLEANATDFEPEDLMRVRINGVDRTADILIGGEFALISLDPAPVGAPQFVELLRRTGDTVHDTFTWNAVPYAGPTLASVAPESAREGQQVLISGAGFAAGAVRVFFGGVEGAVDSSDDTTIVATVPVGAIPGLVWVLVGADAAEGLVAFQPLDDQDEPIPFPAAVDPVLFAAFPANGGVETPVRVYGINFTDEGSQPEFNKYRTTDAFGIETVNFPAIGDILCAFVVVRKKTPTGAGTLQFLERGDSNELPFTVNE